MSNINTRRKFLSRLPLALGSVLAATGLVRLFITNKDNRNTENAGAARDRNSSLTGQSFQYNKMPEKELKERLAVVHKEKSITLKPELPPQS